MFQDALRTSWAYQEIMEEGVEKGLQEQRLTLLEIVHSRFPDIEPLAKKVGETITDLATLRRLIVNISLAQTEESARQALLEFDKSRSKKKR
jgi:predicted transposase YdaD